MRKILTLFIALFCTFCAYAQPPDPPPPPLCLVYSAISIPFAADTVLCLNSGNLLLKGDTTNSTFSGPFVTNGVFSPTAAGTYKIKYTSVDTCIKPDSVNITVVSPPVPPGVISGPTNVCSAEPSSTYTIQTIPGVDYDWSFNPFIIANQPNANATTAQWLLGPAYCGPVTISVATSNGCGTSIAQTLTVNLQCEPIVSLAAGGPYCQTTDTFHLLTSVPGGTWSGCNITPDGVFTPQQLGNCTVSYQYNLEGCTYTRSRNITVNPTATVSVTAPPTACINGGPISITGSPAGGAFTPLLTDPISVGTNTYNYSVNGTYGCSGSATATVEVLDLPTANFGYTIPNCKTICLGDLSQNSFSWTWDYGDGNTGGELNSCHLYDTSGTYCVKQTATNACGSRDTIICITLNCTGLDEIAVNSISIYPNPATTEFTVNTGNLQGAQVELFDIAGRKLVQQNIANSLQTLDVSGLNNGVYICVVTANNRVIKRGKIIVNR